METFRKAEDRQTQTHRSKRLEYYSTLGNKRNRERERETQRERETYREGEREDVSEGE